MMADFLDKFFGGLAGGGLNTGGYGDLLNEAQQKQINQQAQMAMAAKLLQASGRSRQRISLGQALGSGLEAAQGARQAGELSAIQQLLMRQKLGEAGRVSGLAEQARGIMGESQPTEGMPLSPDQAISLGSAGPTTQAAAMIGQPAPKPAVDPNQYRATQYTRLADLYAAQDPEKSKLYQDLAAKFNPVEEVTGQPFEVTGADGKPVLVQQMKSGKVQTLPGFGPKRNVELKDVGGKLVAVDMSQVTGGTEFTKTMTPSEAANLRIAQGGLNLRQQEFNRGAFDLKETPEGFAYVPKTPGGTAIPVMGASGKPLTGVGSAPTEGQANASGFAQRMERVQGIIPKLEAAGAYPGAGSATAGAVPFIGGALKRTYQSADEQKYEQAAQDWIRAKLRKESGAAIGKDEMAQEYATYFPSVGDTPEVIAQKAAARQVATEAMKTAAGRSYKPYVAPAPAEPPVNQSPRKMVFKNGKFVFE